MDFLLESERAGSFLSVRAGGQRKLCSFKPGQRLALPEFGPGRVKIEVLEQVGVIALPSDTSDVKVAVPCSNGKPVEVLVQRRGPAKSSSVPALPPLSAPAEADREAPIDKESAAIQQRQYLEDAGVDEIFEEVVREVLLHKPKDVRSFLRKHFAGGDTYVAPTMAPKLGETCRELEQWAKHYQTVGQELEAEKRALLKNYEDAKQEALWWRMRCEQQFDSIGELEAQTAKADENEVKRKAAEAAAADAEKELFDLQQLKKSQVSALEREVARLGETVHRQTEEISRTR